MATQEYNADRAGLDAPRRTDPEADSTIGSERGWKQEQEKPSSQDQVDGAGAGAGAGAGYGGVSEDEPPHHKIHSEDEPLPKPKSGSYYAEAAEAEADGGFATPTHEEPRDESAPEDHALPTPTESGRGGQPTSTQGYQDFRTSQSPLHETPAIKSRSFGDDTKSDGVPADPVSAVSEAPVDDTVQDRGFGSSTKTPEPVGATPDSPAPKKEGFVQKLVEKLPGHHKTASPDAVEATTPTDTGSPKKSFVTKIKEKLPGHHRTEQTDIPTVE